LVNRQSIIPLTRIQGLILMIRGQRVILDSDPVWLYGVETNVLNQAVKRNKDRFPEDFVFRLSRDEEGALRSQTVTSNSGRGGRRYTPFTFKEHGFVFTSGLYVWTEEIEVDGMPFEEKSACLTTELRTSRLSSPSNSTN